MPLSTNSLFPRGIAYIFAFLYSFLENTFVHDLFFLSGEPKDGRIIHKFDMAFFTNYRRYPGGKCKVVFIFEGFFCVAAPSKKAQTKPSAPSSYGSKILRQSGFTLFNEGEDRLQNDEEAEECRCRDIGPTREQFAVGIDKGSDRSVDKHTEQ